MPELLGGLPTKNGNITKFYLNHISSRNIIYEHWYPPQHKTWSQFVLALLCPRHHKHADATRLHIGERTVALGLHRSWRVRPWHQPGITGTHKLAMGPGLCLKQWTCDSTLLVIAFSQTNVMFSRSLNGSLVPISGVILAEWHRKSYERSAKPQLKNAIFGSKLSFLGVHYIVLQYILIASFASPGKLRAESLFTPPLQRLKHVWPPCAFFCSAPTVWYGMMPVNATANHSCTILPQIQKQVWIQLFEEVWMSSHSDMFHAFHSLPSVWVANHHHGPMLLPWLSSSRRKIAKPDLTGPAGAGVPVCPRWTRIY